MTRNTKIFLAVGGIIVILCLCGVISFQLVSNFTQNLVVNDPGEAAAAAREIVDYQLPRGYQELGMFNFFVGKMVMIGKGGGFDGPSQGTMIMLFELPIDENIDSEEARTQMAEGLRRANLTGAYEMELVGERVLIIRGQSVELLTFEGLDEEGQRTRQIFSGLFQGKSGPVMLAIFGTQADWNQPEIDAFIQSIR